MDGVSMASGKERKVLEIAFRKDVTVESTSELEDLMIAARLERKDILLTITSTGGNPFAAFGFYDWVRIKEIPLVTLALGNVDSAAIILFLAGETRIASAHALFRFHEFNRTIRNNTSFNVSEFSQIARQYEKEQAIYIDIVAERCGKSREEIERLLHKRVAMTAQEAHAFGLAHEIK